MVSFEWFLLFISLMLSSYRPDDQLVNSVQIHWPKASFFETNEDPAQTNITFWLQSPMYQHVRVR